MGQVTQVPKYIARKILKRIPLSSLEKIEDVIQKQLGKGSGAWTTREEAKAIADLTKTLRLSEVVAIDAGANLGNWSAGLLEYLPEARIIAFEPSKIAFEKLHDRFSSDERITCVNLALGKEGKTSTLYADESGSGLGSLTKRRLDHFDIDFVHSESVEVCSLDSWIANQKLPPKPKILKMDVEGHEFDLLLGAVETIKSVQLVQFEFGGSNIDTRTFFQDFWYFFQDLNFEIYRLGPARSFLVRTYSERDESFRATNYVAVRKNV
jgi:FkbM family methyltransferase